MNKYPKVMIRVIGYAVVNPTMVPPSEQVVAPTEEQHFIEARDIDLETFSGVVQDEIEGVLEELFIDLTKNAEEAREEMKESIKKQMKAFEEMI